MTPRCLFVSMLLIALAAPLARGADEPAAAAVKHAASLKQAVDRFHKAMLSENADDHAAAMRHMLPIESDVKALFPGQSARVWKMLSPIVMKNIADASAFARAFRQRAQAAPIKELRAIDIRTDVAGKAYEPVIALMKPDVPLYRIEMVRDEAATGSSAYLLVNDRWVWIRGLELIPDILENQEPPQ